MGLCVGVQRLQLCVVPVVKDRIPETEGGVGGERDRSFFYLSSKKAKYSLAPDSQEDLLHLLLCKLNILLSQNKHFEDVNLDIFIKTAIVSCSHNDIFKKKDN